MQQEQNEYDLALEGGKLRSHASASLRRPEATSDLERTLSLYTYIELPLLESVDDRGTMCFHGADVDDKELRRE